MTFSAAIASCLRNYATFRGRAPRSEFWYFLLFGGIGSVAAMIADSLLHTPTVISSIVNYGPLYVLWVLFEFLPGLSVMVRRLHDTDRSGWWYWINLAPIVGVILFLVWMCTKGTQGDNRFGPAPFMEEAAGNSHKPMQQKLSPGTDKTDRLTKLKALFDSGAISQEEFQRLKQTILNA